MAQETKGDQKMYDDDDDEVDDLNELNELNAKRCRDCGSTVEGNCFYCKMD